MDEFTLFALEAGPDQLYLTAKINNGTSPPLSTAEKLCSAAASVLDSRGMRILGERVFGSLDFYQSYTQIRKNHHKSDNTPFSYIHGAPIHGRGLSGIQIHAVKPEREEDLQVLYDMQHPCGSAWTRKDSTYVYLAGIHGFQDGSPGRKDQAASMFENMKRLLAARSIDFRNVVRTWIYLEDILDWYDTFNTVRTERFRSFGLIPGSGNRTIEPPPFLPASTGIGGRNPAGTFCCSDVLAICGPVKISILQGNFQPAAYSYGSAFSRGICVEQDGLRQIFVSGTAAIDAKGCSLYPGNAEAQIDRTLNVIEALIEGKGANLKDIRSSTVYLKKAEDLKVYEKVAGRFGLPELPVVCVVADICRDELLFEMDAIAVVDSY